MKKIRLDRRDRETINREDAENVFALACSAYEIAIDIEPALIAARAHITQTGERYAYVVIRVERGEYG